MEVASALATPIWECCAKNITYFFTLPENLEAMEKSINRLKRIRGDVMERINREETNLAEPVKRTHDVSGWLQAVEASEQEVGKILEENEDLKIGLNNCCCWSPNTCWRAYKLNNLVSHNLSNVERLLSESDFQTVTNRCQLYSVQEMPTVRMEGMDSIFDEVLNLLVVDSVGVIGLYGMGGVGKTTLLKKISNSFAKGNRDFESVMWVKVPKDRNLKDIQNQIGAILGLSWEDKKGTEKRSLDIHQVLKNKRFLLCLDDVWERVDLERVGIPKIDIQEEETANSKVVFTTRSENVCGLMDADRRIKVDCLRWQEAWSLFREKVKQDALNCHPDVAELAQKVAKECLGLPLALVTIGRTMASKTTLQQWHHALNILRGSPAKFPGYTINTEELIELWIEEGFLDEVCDLNGAHEVIGSLKSACLLEGCFGMENQVKMHDVVRDMAIWVASDLEEEKKYLYLTLQTRGTVTFDGDEKIQRISLIENKAIKRLSGAPICPYLSTLLLMNKIHPFYGRAHQI